jgi:hypothetical protein
MTGSMATRSLGFEKRGLCASNEKALAVDHFNFLVYSLLRVCLQPLLVDLSSAEEGDVYPSACPSVLELFWF